MTREEISEEKEIGVNKPIADSVLILFMTCLAVIIIAIFADMMWFNNRYFNYLWYSKEPNYKVPDGWQIVSNGKIYAIKRTMGYDSGQYLHTAKYGVELYHKEVAYDLFIDSNNAKAFLKSYLDEQNKDSQNLSDFK